MNLDNVFNNNKEWIQKQLSADSNFFNDLGQGQSPELLYIGCSDSRVTAEDLMGMGPGEVFVHRNIANMVISIDLNVMSVVNYAVDHLKVNHVVVCGHYACGGVKAAMQSADLGILNPWLRNIRDVYRIHRDELNAIEDEDKKYDLIIDRGALVCAPLSEVKSAIKQIHQLLNVGAKFLFTPFSQQHSCFDEKLCDEECYLTITQGPLQKVGKLSFVNDSIISEIFAKGWKILSLRHITDHEQAQESDYHHAEYRIIVEKVQ